jgi:hypothetical protein
MPDPTDERRGELDAREFSFTAESLRDLEENGLTLEEIVERLEASQANSIGEPI